MTRRFGLKRWLVVWLVLLSMSATLARYFDNGPPASWPHLARVITESFLAPGGIIWTALFWHAFGNGPILPGLVLIALVNSILWGLAIYVAVKIVGSLTHR